MLQLSLGFTPNGAEPRHGLSLAHGAEKRPKWCWQSSKAMFSLGNWGTNPPLANVGWYRWSLHMMQRDNLGYRENGPCSEFGSPWKRSWSRSSHRRQSNLPALPAPPQLAPCLGHRRVLGPMASVQGCNFIATYLRVTLGGMQTSAAR